MADTSSPADPVPGKPVTPSWKQVGLVLLAGIILVPGLCFGVIAFGTASGGTVMDSAGSIVVILLVLSILLTLGAGLLAAIRIMKDIRRR
jgi:hypothetical protein